MTKQKAILWCKNHTDQVIGDYKVVRFSQSVTINHHYCAYCIKVETGKGFYVPIKLLEEERSQIFKNEKNKQIEDLKNKLEVRNMDVGQEGS